MADISTTSPSTQPFCEVNGIRSTYAVLLHVLNAMFIISSFTIMERERISR
ncbi:hypothetical protein KIN20_027870 [Parelaphostrongylus tenuis]|uniref:Uncharacterized protein n=1 Tax=Parelaphostrongylus tenuis TaxID=148309 RepID=A0AAD5QZX8_PARTN|nr:hypothetical protein KIN20_027870 [Parelaphostrongylus tenuis]